MMGSLRKEFGGSGRTTIVPNSCPITTSSHLAAQNRDRVSSHRQWTTARYGTALWLPKRGNGEDSVRHRVGNDVDPKGIGDLVRVPFEVLDVLAFAFPAIGDIVVVAEDSHQTIFVIEVTPEMW